MKTAIDILIIGVVIILVCYLFYLYFQEGEK